MSARCDVPEPAFRGKLVEPGDRIERFYVVKVGRIDVVMFLRTVKVLDCRIRGDRIYAADEELFVTIGTIVIWA